MQTLTIEIKDSKSLKALRDLEQKHMIRILKESESDIGALDSFSLAGDMISEEEFKKWVENAEESSTVSLTEAKQKWAVKKAKLQKHIR